MYGLPKNTEDWLPKYLEYLQSPIDLYSKLIKEARPSVPQETKEAWQSVVISTIYARDLIKKRGHKLFNCESLEDGSL